MHCKFTAIEIKLADKWNSAWEKPLRELAVRSDLKVERLFGVYTGQRSYVFNGIKVLPVAEFLTIFVK